MSECKVCLIRHIDGDGAGTEIIAKMCGWYDVVKVIEAENYNINEIMQEYLSSGKYKKFDKTIIADIGVNEEIATKINELVNKGYSFSLFDHHPKKAYMDKFDWAKIEVVDENSKRRSATKLMYDTLCVSDNEKLKKLVTLIDEYDTWNWEEHNNSFPVSFDDLFWFYKDSGLDWVSTMIDRVKNDLPLTTKEDDKIMNIILKDKEIYFDEMFSKMEIKELALNVDENNNSKSFKVGVLTEENPKYISLLGNKLCRKDLSLDFVAVVRKDKGYVSLRTIKDDVDLSKIAGINFDGGGHKKASGCSYENFNKYL